MNYQYISDGNGGTRNDIIIRIDENNNQSFIPNNVANSDWQAYQVWLAAGNTPQAPN